MHIWTTWGWIAFAMIAVGGLSRDANAIILYGGPDGRNTTAPVGVLSNAGWQFEGNWGVGAGTAIAPNYFVTARHLGGSVGDKFTVHGIDYTTIAAYDDPTGTDLKIWKVAQTFSTYAPIYTGTADATSDPLMIVFGRGTARGSAVVGPNGNQGYLWGNSDGALSWGLNRVTFTTGMPGGPSGDFLAFEFNPNGWSGVSNAGTVSSGDSGGGLFIQDTDGVWKLAGVNYAVDGNFSTQPDSGFFQAAMYDARDYYVGEPGNSFLVTHPDPDGPIWQSAYASRISTRADFIRSVTLVPEPMAFALMGLGLLLVGGAQTVRLRAGRAGSQRSSSSSN